MLNGRRFRWLIEMLHCVPALGEHGGRRKAGAGADNGDALLFVFCRTIVQLGSWQRVDYRAGRDIR